MGGLADKEWLGDLLIRNIPMPEDLDAEVSNQLILEYKHIENI